MANLFSFLAPKPKRERALILHIDDDEDILAMMRIYLESMNLDVLSADDALEGVELARAKEPDMILLDIRMPGIDGFEACRRIKAQPKSKNIPILMLTAMGQVKDIEKALASGASGYLVKPVEFPQLQTKITEFLKIDF